MTAYVYKKMPMTLHDFGECYMTDWQTELYDHIIGAHLPAGLTWCGDELLAEVEDDEPEDFDLDEILCDAWEEFCGFGTREQLIAAAEKYDLALPEPGEPMYYDDSLDGDSVCDINGQRITTEADDE